MRRNLFFCYLLLACTVLYSQSEDAVTRFFDRLNHLEFLSAEQILDEKKTDSVHDLRGLLLLIRDKKSLNIEKYSSAQKYYASDIVKELMIAYQTLYQEKDKGVALKHFDKAYNLSKREVSNPIQYFCIKEILTLFLSKEVQSNNDYKRYLQNLYQTIESNSQLLSYYGFKFSLLSQTETYDTKVSKNENIFASIFIAYDSVADLVDQKDKVLYKYYLDKGNRIIKANPDLAEKFYTKSLNLLSDELYFNSPKKLIYFNFARANIEKNEYSLALKNIETAKGFMDMTRHSNLFAYHTYKSIVFQKMKVLDSALFHGREARYNQINWDLQKQNVEISLMQVKLRTAEKEKSLYKTRSWLLGASMFIVLMTIIGYLIIHDSRKKRFIALQEKELETQKNINLLKEQEITTINAMVEGQEKERKRVAEDLHDNLGNVIATLKMHFENLRINQERKKVDQESLFEKTEGLIDEAYRKVRTMAHAKNSGVIANQGLLVAVKLMAEKVSSANTIKIEVIDYGLEKRLDNSLEIALFRIIQELTTNIIKHSQASEATINISQDEEDITILIEDNGIGMDTSQIDVKKGMGLHSIRTRVEHLDGSFTIDSTPTKGTTIIIQIPS